LVNPKHAPADPNVRAVAKALDKEIAHNKFRKFGVFVLEPEDTGTDATQIMVGFSARKDHEEDWEAIARFETKLMPKLNKTILKGWKDAGSGVGMGSAEWYWEAPTANPLVFGEKVVVHVARGKLVKGIIWAVSRDGRTFLVKAADGTMLRDVPKRKIEYETAYHRKHALARIYTSGSLI
jgi:hypothetical protein